MSEKLRILLLEDVASDAELAEHALRKAKFVFSLERKLGRGSTFSFTLPVRSKRLRIRRKEKWGGQRGSYEGYEKTFINNINTSGRREQ